MYVCVIDIHLWQILDQEQQQQHFHWLLMSFSFFLRLH